MKKALAFTLLTLVAVSSGWAQEVVAGLSSNRAAVGEPVQLVVTVRGARGADVPQTLAVNGLRINLAGRSTQFEMRNFKMNSTLTYTYIVVPLIEGEFTIPSFDVTVEGKTFRTQAMRLSASGAAQVPALPGLPQNAPPLPPVAGQPPDPQPDANAKPYFAELILSKKTAYVGEIVPVELRFYFHSRIGGQVGERPNFGGEGFTVQKFSNAVKRDQVVNETNYVVFTFQSAITPVKSGVLEIPAASLEARLQVPGRAPQGFDDFFNNLPIPQGMFAETREVTLETKPQKLEVIALPKDGRPEDFSGAVGKFTMDASVSPKKAGPGEPVTLKVAIGGQGNFEGMGAPVLTGDEGWRTYPASDKFQATDSIGFTGEKTFEFPIIAREDQVRTPGVRFSFFDPSISKYVTLTQNPLDVSAKAGGPSGAPAPAAAAGQPAAGATPAPTAASTPDITAMAGGSKSWSSVLLRKDFLIANACLALAWFALVAGMILRRFSLSPAGQRLARSRRSKEALSRLRSSQPEAFYDGVGHFLALRFGTADDSILLSGKIAASGLPDELKSPLLAMLDRRDELKFASGGAVPPSADERERVLLTLKQLSASHEN